MSGGFPRVRIVSAPRPDATVLYDCHTETTGVRTWPKADGWDLGSPTLQGAADGVAISYGDRTLSFTQIIAGSKFVALPLQSTLAKLLLRPSGWLEFTLAAFTKPVWFRLRYAEPQSLSFAQVRSREGDLVPDRWAIGMRLPAAPFAYGERITLPVVSITNNPASGAHPAFAVLPEILGDAPAPARIRLRYSASQPGRRHMLATSPVPVGYDAPIWWQIGTGDDWDIGDDTGAPVADVDYAGGSYRPVTFAAWGDEMSTRVLRAKTLTPGTYKVLLRCARSDTDSTFTVRLGVDAGAQINFGDTIALTWPVSAAEHAAWADLGQFRFPTGNPLVDLTDEPDVSSIVRLQVGRLAGDGHLHLNGLLLIPVEDQAARTLFVDRNSSAPEAAVDDEYHDTDLTAVYCRTVTGGVLKATDPPGLQGGFPLLVPGARNAVHFLEQTSISRARYATIDGEAPDRITTVVDVEVSYQPQWLWIGNGSAP
jgi:hypothetical protein